MGICYVLQSKLFRFIGDIKWTGIARPFWFVFNATGYQLKGEHYRKLATIIQPGDIVIRRFEGYIDKWFIPGFWNHAGIYVGGEKEQVVHAISEGVIIEDILNFMRTDHMLVLRPPNGDFLAIGVEKARSIIGKPYDFGFDFKDCNRFSCTELVAYCYPGIVKPKCRPSSLGKKVIVADDFKTSQKLTVIWDSTQD